MRTAAPTAFASITERCRPARAAERDREIAPPLALVPRQHEADEGEDPPQEAPPSPAGAGGRRRPRRRRPLSRRSRGNEVRVGQEARVEHEVGLGRHPVLVAEGEHGHHHPPPLRPHVVALAHVVAQLVHGEARGVEDHVRHLADGPQRLALRADPLDGRLRPRQGVGPPRLAEAAQQRPLVRLEEHEARRAGPGAASARGRPRGTPRGSRAPARPPPGPSAAARASGR